MLQDVTFKHVLGIHPKISFEKKEMKKDICFPFNRDRWENNNTCQKRKHKMCYTNRSLILEKIPESKIISPNDKIAPLPRNRNIFYSNFLYTRMFVVYNNLE